MNTATERSRDLLHVFTEYMNSFWMEGLLAYFKNMLFGSYITESGRVQSKPLDWLARKRGTGTLLCRKMFRRRILSWHNKEYLLPEALLVPQNISSFPPLRQHSSFHQFSTLILCTKTCARWSCHSIITYSSKGKVVMEKHWVYNWSWTRQEGRLSQFNSWSWLKNHWETQPKHFGPIILFSGTCA